MSIRSASTYIYVSRRYMHAARMATPETLHQDHMGRRLRHRSMPVNWSIQTGQR